MEFLSPISLLEDASTLLPAVLWASIMTSLCLMVFYLVLKFIGDLVNPCLVYGLWLLLGVRMFLLTMPYGSWDGFGPAGKYITLLWLAGVVTTFASFCTQHAWHYRDILRWETRLPEWLHSLFLEVREELRLGARPTLIITEATNEPLLMGTFRPVIVLPVELAREENQEYLRQILRHEMAHLSGRDLWLAWFWIFAMSLHWFNPLIWLARRTLGLWREIACDWRVTGRMSERERLEYGRTLLAVAQGSSGSNWSGAACVTEKQCDIERRIAMISKKFPKMKRRFFSNAFLGTTVILFFVGTICFPLYQKNPAIAAQNDAIKAAQIDPKPVFDTPEPVSDAPEIVKLSPENGATDVDPAKVTRLRVTFDRDMDTGGFSWCGSGPSFPETVGMPKWINKRTCILPVKLMPDKTYQLSINAPSFKNFRSTKGVPAVPVPYSFTTSGKPLEKTDSKLDDKEDSSDGKPIPLELLKEIRDKRAAIHSADYSVETVVQIDGEKLFGGKANSLFRFQGDDQWLVEISEIMQSANFQGGCDGSEEWSYYIPKDSSAEPSYKIRFLTSIARKDVNLLDPFRCRNISEDKLESHRDRLTAEGYRYLGENEVEGKKVHRFTFSHNDRFHHDDMTTSTEITLDNDTLLPNHVVTETTSSRIEIINEMKFAIHALNQEYGKADFQPENTAKLEPEKVTQPESGYSKFYVIVDDGSDGRMSVRLNGQQGEKGTRSSGLN